MAGGAPLDEAAVAAAASRLSSSRRYRRVCPEVALRFAREEAAKSRSANDLHERLRRRLHQAFGAYDESPRYDRWLAALAEASTSDDPDAFRSACRSAMAGHASTRERLPILDRFYPTAWGNDGDGPPRRVVDLACGLNPLALPWMGLPSGAEYEAWDINTELATFLTSFFGLAGISGRAGTRDLAAGPPPGSWDLALLLKAIPCLEHQRPGLSADLIDQIDARRVVVSYPTRSLGGRSKGMGTTYREQFRALASGRPWRIREVDLRDELIFVIAKDDRCSRA